jgi:hypothetical protein
MFAANAGQRADFLRTQRGGGLEARGARRLRARRKRRTPSSRTSCWTKPFWMTSLQKKVTPSSAMICGWRKSEVPLDDSVSCGPAPASMLERPTDRRYRS